MANLKNSDQEILTEFHNDTLLWISMLGYMENDLQFINRLLNSKAFKDKVPNLFERLQNYLHEMKTKTRELKNFKKEINEYVVELKGILECQDISCDTFYLENHRTLKNHFEKLYTEFNDYKTRIFNYTGGILR